MQLGPLTFLAHYTYAREQYLLLANGPNVHRLEKEAAVEIRAHAEEMIKALGQ
jgi:hypothetical protein